MFLLDTTVFSELRKASRCHPAVAAWQAAQRPESCFLSVIVILEIRLGIELARRTDKAKAQVLEDWLEQRLKPGFAGRILPVDQAVAEKCGCLHAQRTRSFRDGLILATANLRGLTVVTRNARDFAEAGVPVINPWE